jgi:hypothetical protein
MKRLIDVASGSDPTIEDSSWDNFQPSIRAQDIANNTSDWQEDGLPPRVRQDLCVVGFSEQPGRISG